MSYLSHNSTFFLKKNELQKTIKLEFIHLKTLSHVFVDKGVYEKIKNSRGIIKIVETPLDLDYSIHIYEVEIKINDKFLIKRCTENFIQALKKNSLEISSYYETDEVITNFSICDIICNLQKNHPYIDNLDLLPREMVQNTDNILEYQENDMEIDVTKLVINTNETKENTNQMYEMFADEGGVMDNPFFFNTNADNNMFFETVSEPVLNNNISHPIDNDNVPENSKHVETDIFRMIISDIEEESAKDNLITSKAKSNLSNNEMIVETSNDNSIKYISSPTTNDYQKNDNECNIKSNTSLEYDKSKDNSDINTRPDEEKKSIPDEKNHKVISYQHFASLSKKRKYVHQKEQYQNRQSKTVPLSHRKKSTYKDRLDRYKTGIY